jgi:hypothetical protein
MMFEASRDRLDRLCPYRDQYLEAALRHATLREYADVWTGDIPGIVAAWASADSEALCRERLAGMLALAVDVQCAIGRAHELPVFEGLRPDRRVAEA